MAKHYDAVVLGAGIGGLASALLMASAGKKVAVFEKNERPGGRLGSRQRDDFKVDYGVHLISRGPKGPLVQLLDRCGVENTLEFTKVRPVQSTGGEIFKFPQDLKGRVPDEDFAAVMNLVMGVKDMTDEEMHELDDSTLEEYLNRLSTNPLVHACISQVGYIYCCIPEYILSAGEFCRCMKWEAEAHASGYPAGGCGAIVQAYVDGLEKYGAELHVGTPVTKVIVEDGKAVGIIAGGEEHRADYIVSNSDIKQTVLELVGPEHFDDEYVQYVKDLQYSMISLLARFALDTVISPDIHMLSNFSSLPPREYYDILCRGELPEDLNSFVVVPTSFDPTLAPEGKQLIAIGSAVPYGIDESLCPAILDAAIANAETYFPGLRDHVVFTERVYPSDAARDMGEEGAGIGIAQAAGQAGNHRPAIKTPLEGLYIVGAEAGGDGVGLEMCANSAMEFFDNYVA